MNPAINEFEVVKYVSLMIHEGAKTTLPVSIRSWNALFDIELVKDGRGPGIVVTEGVGRATIRLHNFDNPLGSGITAPMFLGKSPENNLDIFFMLAHWKIGVVDKVDFQFMTKPSGT